MGGYFDAHDYSHDGGRRFYCTHNLERYYLACHRWYSCDKFDGDSTLINVHNNPRLYGENFSCDNFENEFCLYYKDDKDGMKNWMLYIHKQSNNDYYTPIFHRSKCSKFILEYDDNDNDSFFIKETHYNVYLYMNLAKLRDLNKDGCSFYVGASSERDKATKFKYIDIERLA